MKMGTQFSRFTWASIFVVLVFCVGWELYYVIFRDVSDKPTLYLVNAACLPVNLFNLRRFVKIYDYMWNGRI